MGDIAKCKKGVMAAVCMLCVVALGAHADYQVTIDCADSIGPLYPFWQSTGFAKTDGREANYQYQSSVPFDNMLYVREHNLLNKVTVTVDGGHYSWDFSGLDEEIDKMVRNGQKPILEMMGNPEGLGAQGDALYRAQYDLAKTLARHYIEKYGAEEVRSWYFQNTNEPAVDEDFLKHYDACSQGFYEVDPQLRFGGPGTKDYQTDGVYRLLDHCANGTNFITGEQGTPIAWYSIHTKLEATEAVSLEAEVIGNVRSRFPQYADLPFMNDEGDRRCCYRHSYWWHSNNAYAAWMADMLNQHCVRIIDSLKAPLVIWSNDFDFAVGWEQRSQFIGKGAEIIKKPCHNAMVMFSQLGNARVATEGTLPLSSGNGVVATRRGRDRVAIMVYSSARSEDNSTFIPTSDSRDHKVRLDIENIAFGEGAFIHYRIDSVHTNPYRFVRRNDSAATPLAKDELYARIRDSMELEYSEPPEHRTFQNNALTVDLEMPMNTASLILITRQPEDPPSPVSNIRYHVTDISNRRGTQNTMVMWDEPETRTVWTYEVLFAEDESGPYERVNKAEFFTTAFAHIETPPGHYKVRVVDFWGRTSDGAVRAGPVRSATGSRRHASGTVSRFLVGAGVRPCRDYPSTYDIRGRRIAAPAHGRKGSPVPQVLLRYDRE